MSTQKFCDICGNPTFGKPPPTPCSGLEFGEPHPESDPLGMLETHQLRPVRCSVMARVKWTLEEHREHRDPDVCGECAEKILLDLVQHIK